MSMDPTHIPSSEASTSAPLLKRNLVDVGWDYGVIVDPSNKDRLQCLLCGLQYTGGCKKAIDDNAAKKKNKKKAAMDIREEVNIVHEGDEIENVAVGSKKRPYVLGPMDRYTNINPDSSDTSGFKKTRQPNINDAIWKEKSHKEEVERTKTFLKKQEEEWALTGCSIMTDAWTDRKRRSIMNLCVNCKQGTCFLSSKEDSEASHTGVYIFDYVDKFIEDIGAQNVVQVVTDNASNNMAAADLLKIKRPNIFWTSCGTHTINLMLEGIGKQSKFKATIDKAKAFTIFVYAHHNTLAMRRKYTKKRDIVRPGVTRFATSFLTLQSLMEKKQELRAMFSSNAWGESKWAKSPKGKAAYATVMSQAFWNGVTLCLKVFGLSVMVLRLVDGDQKPSMGYVYGELTKAKEEIKAAYKQVETNYRPILDVIDGKAKGRLDSALHLTAYFLNPFYFFNNSTIQDDPIIMDGVLTCVEAFFPDDVNVRDEVINRD
ncbi:hypothetical protein RHGRI_029392 [Rhododendron griersonianum]|uniref:DUF659 domain-containing protein n=1 Tax=Rhododendron griersonianum TaxID=479676 RepID=A0AAV6IME3_9ERIC|nr:hypothetical protein RHGRI_029392 [Rhododendron griersonianum]